MLFKKNKKMKWWLSLGAVASVTAVSAIAISCVAPTTSTTTPTKTTKEETPTDVPNSMRSIQDINLNSNILNSPLQVLNDENKLTTVDLPTNVQQEFILSKYYYSGQINASENGITYINSTKAKNYRPNDRPGTPAIMMSPSDSLVLVFNQNSNNNISQMKSYINTLYFNDTSIAPWASNQAGVINARNGKYIKFNDSGLSTSYYGSQTNHIFNPPSFEIWLEQISESYKNDPTSWQALLNYYGFMKNADGKYVVNPDIEDPASTFFYPLGIIPKTLWLVKQVASNAFAFTYNANIKEVPTITVASISQVLTSVDGDANISATNPKVTSLTPQLSLGTPYEWNFFMKKKYSVIGQKLTKLTDQPFSGEKTNIDIDLIIDTNLINGVINPDILSYINFLVNNVKPTTAILISTNLSNAILDKYSLYLKHNI